MSFGRRRAGMIILFALIQTFSLSALDVTHTIGLSSAVLFTSYDSTPYAQPASVSLAYHAELAAPVIGERGVPVAGVALELFGFARREENYGPSLMLLPRAEIGVRFPLVSGERVSIVPAVGGGFYIRRVSRSGDVRQGRRPVATGRIGIAARTDSRWTFGVDPGFVVFADDEPVLGLRIGVNAALRLGGAE
ncbi:MAG: hypothetical protein R6W94_13795 [Spirochaetia bacterium]